MAKAGRKPIPQQLWMLAIGFAVRAGSFGLLSVEAPYLLDRGVPVGSIGAIMASATVGSAVSQLFAGRLIDSFGPRLLIIVSCAVSAVAYGVFPFTPNWWVLTIASMVGAVGAGIGTNALRSAVASTVREDELEQAFGRLTSAQTVGGLIGPVFLGVVVVSGIGAAPWFATTGLAAALVLALTGKLPTRAGSEREQARGPKAAGIAKAVAPFVSIVTATSLLYGIYAVAWGLLLQDLGASNLLIAWSFAIFSLPMTVVSPRVGKILPKVDRWKVAAGATVALGCLAFVYALTRIVWVAIALSAADGIMMGISIPLVMSCIAKSVPPEAYGRAFGIAGAVDSVSGAVGTAFAGTLIAFGGIPFSFRLGGIYCVGVTIFSVIFVSLRRRRRRARGSTDGLVESLGEDTAPLSQ